MPWYDAVNGGVARRGPNSSPISGLLGERYFGELELATDPNSQAEGLHFRGASGEQWVDREATSGDANPDSSSSSLIRASNSSRAGGLAHRSSAAAGFTLEGTAAKVLDGVAGPSTQDNGMGSTDKLMRVSDSKSTRRSTESIRSHCSLDASGITKTCEDGKPFQMSSNKIEQVGECTQMAQHDGKRLDVASVYIGEHMMHICKLYRMHTHAKCSIFVRMGASLGSQSGVQPVVLLHHSELREEPPDDAAQVGHLKVELLMENAEALLT